MPACGAAREEAPSFAEASEGREEEEDEEDEEEEEEVRSPLDLLCAEDRLRALDGFFFAVTFFSLIVGYVTRTRCSARGIRRIHAFSNADSFPSDLPRPIPKIIPVTLATTRLR